MNHRINMDHIRPIRFVLVCISCNSLPAKLQPYFCFSNTVPYILTANYQIFNSVCIIVLVFSGYFKCLLYSGDNLICLRGLGVARWTTDHSHCVQIPVWAYLKVVSSLTLLLYLWRSLGPFSLPCAQKWS